MAAATHDPEIYEAWFRDFAGAWSRQFPAVLRHKLEGGRQFTLPREGVWEAEEDSFLSSLMNPQQVWYRIERELLRGVSDPPYRTSGLVYAKN